MIRFQCPGCSTGLRVALAKGGKLTRCPNCGRTVRAPERRPGEVEIVEELPVVEDEEEAPELEEVEPAADEEEEEEREEEERPRRRRRRRDDEDDDDDEGPPVIRSRRAGPTEAEELDEESRREVITWNRVMGVIGIVFGIGFTSGAIVAWVTGAADLVNPLATPASAGGCGALLLGLALIGVGAFYIYRG